MSVKQSVTAVGRDPFVSLMMKMLSDKTKGGGSVFPTGGPLLLRSRLRGWRFTGLLRSSGLGIQNRDANILTGLDVVKIVQPRVELMNLLQKLRRAISKFLHTDTKQGLPFRHLDGAHRVNRLRTPSLH